MIDLPQSNTAVSVSRAWLRMLDGIRVLAVLWLLLVGVWSAPLPGASLAYPNGLLWVEAVLALTLLLSARYGSVKSPRDYPFLWPCLGVIGLLTIATALRQFVAGVPFDGLRLWQYGEPMLRGALLYLAIAGQPRLARPVWWGLLGGLLAQAPVCIAQHIHGDTRWYPDMDDGWASGFVFIHGRRAQGLTSYINLTAAMLAASLPYFLVPAIRRTPAGRLPRLLLILGGLAVAAALWYTNSRGPLIAVLLVASLYVAGFSPAWRLGGTLACVSFLLAALPGSRILALTVLLAAIVLGFIGRRYAHRVLIPIAIGLGLAGGIQVFDAFVLHYSLHLRVMEQGIKDRQRLMIYRDAATVALRAPWWGAGDAAVGDRLLHLPDKDLNDIPRVQRNAHNQYLQWAAANGFPVAIAFTLLVVWTVAWCGRMARRPELPPAMRTLALATTAALSIFLLTNLVDAHLWRMEGSGFFWTLAAVTAALVQSSRFKVQS